MLHEQKQKSVKPTPYGNIKPDAWFLPKDVANKASKEEIEAKLIDIIQFNYIGKIAVKMGIRNFDEIEDIKQDILLKLLQTKGSFFEYFDSRKSALVYYVYRTSRNYIITYLNRKKKLQQKIKTVDIDSVAEPVAKETSSYETKEDYVQEKQFQDKRQIAFETYLERLQPWAKAGYTYLQLFKQMLVKPTNKAIADYFGISTTRVIQIKKKIKEFACEFIKDFPEYEGSSA